MNWDVKDGVVPLSPITGWQCRVLGDLLVGIRIEFLVPATEGAPETQSAHQYVLHGREAERLAGALLEASLAVQHQASDPSETSH